LARHYSTKDFFRQMPNALLVRYFHARGLLGDLDFSAMRETSQTSCSQRGSTCLTASAMRSEFRDIFELSCEKGFRAIIDEAEWHLAHDTHARRGFVEKLAALSNHYERAMVTFSTTMPSGRGPLASITPTRFPTGASARTCRSSLRG
jgi:hypothetical protein